MITDFCKIMEMKKKRYKSKAYTNLIRSRIRNTDELSTSGRVQRLLRERDPSCLLKILLSVIFLVFFVAQNMAGAAILMKRLRSRIRNTKELSTSGRVYSLFRRRNPSRLKTQLEPSISGSGSVLDLFCIYCISLKAEFKCWLISIKVLAAIL